MRKCLLKPQQHCVIAEKKSTHFQNKLNLEMQVLSFPSLLRTEWSDAENRSSARLVYCQNLGDTHSSSYLKVTLQTDLQRKYFLMK